MLECPRKKSREADPKVEVAASKIAREKYKAKQGRTKWHVEVVVAEHTDVPDVLEAPIVNGKKFSQLTAEEKKEASRAVLALEGPDILGEGTEGRVFFNPDGHSENYLYDPAKKSLYVFDTAQSMDLPASHIETFQRLMANLGALRKDTPGGKKAMIHAITKLMDGLNEVQQLVWFERHAGVHTVSDGLAAKVRSGIVRFVNPLVRAYGEDDGAFRGIAFDAVERKLREDMVAQQASDDAKRVAMQKVADAGEIAIIRSDASVPTLRR